MEPVDLKSMTDAQLIEFRRAVLDESDERRAAERSARLREKDLAQITNKVVREIEKFLRSGGTPAELHALLDYELARIAAEGLGNGNNGNGNGNSGNNGNNGNNGNGKNK